MQAPAKAAAVSKTSAADVQKNLDAIKVTSTDEGILKKGNAVELNQLIPANIATWKRRVLREREFSDEHDYHLEGL